MNRRGLALGAAALAALALTPAAADATWRGKAGHIAFDTDDSQGLAIYKVRADGTHARRLAGNASEPVYSPNGRKIAFLHGGGTVWIANADGSHARRVRFHVRDRGGNSAAGAYSPAWSPDGRHLSFTQQFSREVEGGDGAEETTTTYVYTVRTDGRHLRRLHEGHDAVWSPTHHRVAFAQGTGKNRIVSTDLRGRHLRVLARPQPPEVYVNSLDYSPNGRRLVFVHGPDVGVLNVKTGSVREIPMSNDDDLAIHVVWAPGGKRIAYLHPRFPPLGQPAPPSQLRTTRPDGSDRRTLFEFPADLTPPSTFSWQTRRR